MVRSVRPGVDGVPCEARNSTVVGEDRASTRAGRKACKMLGELNTATEDDGGGRVRRRVGGWGLMRPGKRW